MGDRDERSELPARDEELLRTLEKVRGGSEDATDLDLEVGDEEPTLDLAAGTETPITAGEAPPPAQWRGAEAQPEQAADAELIQVPLDIPQKEEEAGRRPSIADAEPAHFSEAQEPPAAPAGERRKRRVRVVKVKRKRRRARPQETSERRSGLAGALGRGGAAEEKAEDHDHRDQSQPREDELRPTAPAAQRRARRLSRKRSRRAGEAAAPAEEASPAGPRDAQPEDAEGVFEAVGERPAGEPQVPKLPSLPEAEPPASEAAAGETAVDETAAQPDGAKPSLWARMAALFRRREAAQAQEERAEADAQQAEGQKPQEGALEAPEDVAERSAAPSRLSTLLSRGSRKAEEEEPSQEADQAQAEAPEASEPQPPAEPTPQPAPEVPSEGAVEPAAGDASDEESGQGEEEQARGRRLVIDADLSEEERRAELERRRLERRRRAERERERREERRRLIRRIRERITGFFRGLINEESEAWAKRRRWLEERKRKREERKAERERKREERKRRREEKPTVFRKIKQRVDAKRAARARRLQRSIAGLEISASRLRAVHLREGKPIDVYEVSLPEGVIVDGMLEEPEELTQAIKRLWREAKLRTKKVNFSIPANRLVAMRTVSLAAENPEDITQALAMMVPRLIAPMDPDKSVVDYAELSRSGPHTDLQVAAADEEMVKAYAQAVSKAGLLPVSCEIGALAASRAIIVPRSPRHAQLVIDIGAETTSVSAASGPDLFYLRVIPLGGNDFTKAIHNKIGLSYGEARQLKEQVGLAGPVPEGVDPELARSAREAMRPVADRLAQEISRTRRDYEEAVFEGERTGRPVTGYLVLGGGAKLRGLVEQIELFAGLPMRHELRPYRGLETASEHLDLTATCLGLARGHTMSLLPDLAPTSFTLSNPLRRKSKISMSAAERQAKRLAQERRRRRQAGTDPRLVGALVGALAIVGAYFIDQRRGPDESALVDPIASQSNMPSLKINYPNDPDAEEMAEALLATPNVGALAKLPKAFASNKARIVGVTVDGSRVIVNATSNQAAAPERVERAVRKGVPEAESVSMQKGEGKAFAIVLDVPHEAEVKQ